MQQKVRDRVVDGDKNIFFGVVMGSSTCPRVILQCLGFFTVHTIERMHDSAVSSSRRGLYFLTPSRRRTLLPSAALDTGVGRGPNKNADFRQISRKRQLQRKT